MVNTLRWRCCIRNVSFNDASRLLHQHFFWSWIELRNKRDFITYVPLKPMSRPMTPIDIAYLLVLVLTTGSYFRLETLFERFCVHFKYLVMRTVLWRTHAPGSAAKREVEYMVAFTTMHLSGASFDRCVSNSTHDGSWKYLASWGAKLDCWQEHLNPSSYLNWIIPCPRVPWQYYTMS